MTRWCNQIGLITAGLCCCLVLSGCQDDTTENDTSVAVNQVQFTPDAEQQGPTLAPAEGEQLDPAMAEPAEVSETPNEAPLNEEEIPPGVLSPEQPFTEPVVVPLKTIEEPTEQLSVRSDSSSETAARFPKQTVDIPQEWANAFSSKTQSYAPGVSNSEINKLAQPSLASGEIQAAVKRAQAHIAKGAQLVERGAVYSARQEFLQALQTQADVLDQQRQTDAHRRALQAGLQTLDEIADLIPNSPAEVIPLADRVAGHECRILHGRDLSQVTANQALQFYQVYAHQQLSAAGGDLLPAADALFALGKLHLLQSQEPDQRQGAELERAKTLLQSALAIEPKHAMAANELGVIYARQGKNEHAKLALQHSASIAAHPGTWRNLAAIHQTLGESQFAQLATRESQLSQERWQRQSQSQGMLANGQIQVVDQNAFARSAPLNSYEQKPGGQMAQQPQPQQPPVTRQAQQAPAGWMPQQR